jgi:NTP pyrophosphatase (non-canonical NTP hydrolase)
MEGIKACEKCGRLKAAQEHWMEGTALEGSCYGDPDCAEVALCLRDARIAELEGERDRYRQMVCDGYAALGDTVCEASLVDCYRDVRFSLATLRATLAETERERDEAGRNAEKFRESMYAVERDCIALRARLERAEGERFGLHEVQEQQRDWVLHNFGERPVWMPVVGVAEEVGELSHAVLKRAQGIRGTKAEHDAAIRDALADIIIFCCDVASAEGFDLEAEVVTTWERVRKRDWKANPDTAANPPPDAAKGG